MDLLSAPDATQRHPGLSGVTPPPAWRQIPPWPGPVPPWPDAGSRDPAWWWVGLHGGAGVTTLTSALPRSGDARRCLPSTGPANCVVVARSHPDGLAAAQDFAKQAACGLLPPQLHLLGLVLVADAPSRPDKHVRRYRRVVTGAFSRTWEVPWIPEWRSHHPDPSAPLPAPVAGLATDLDALTNR